MIHRLRACGAALSAMAMLGALAACTSSGGKGGPTAPVTGASSKASTGKSSKAPTIPSQHPLPDPSKISNSVKLRRQVAITKCVSTPDGWKASGNAVNSGAKKPLKVKITVFFTTTKATVLDYAQTKVDVAPGKTDTWTAAAKFKAETTMRCVLRGVG